MTAVAKVSVGAGAVLLFAALIPAVAAVPAIPDADRQACRAMGERCAGAPGMPLVEWVGCCGEYPDVDCLAHPDAATDKTKWGRFCQDPNAATASNEAEDPVPTAEEELLFGENPLLLSKPGDRAGGAGGAGGAVATSAPGGAGTRVPPVNRPMAGGAGGSPFAGQALYVNPSFQADIDSSIATAAAGAEKSNLETMRDVASAFWLDFKYKVTPGNDSTESASGILKDASTASPVPMVTLIVYDLPNRDCHAKASNGEICCGATNPDGTCNYVDAASSGPCDDGIADYKKNYIDPLAVSVKEYCSSVPMALIIEPDSLPNLVTNAGDPKCGSTATQSAYRKGVTYAVQTLAAACPTATIYVDGAHGGWLGWNDNLAKFAAEVKGLGIDSLIRGFSLNVANYQPTGVPCPSVGFCLAGANADHACCFDPCGLSAEYNSGHNEVNYAAALAAAMKTAMPSFESHMVIDTGRNGKNPRQKCANWCNVRGAGAGVIPTADTAVPAMIDAYLWLKTPGESDGCTADLPDGGKCPRFDSDCASTDSIHTQPGEPLAPEAGGWFDFQVKMLAANAVLK
jgi:cellulose 1,4-beta-cellobiosidase